MNVLWLSHVVPYPPKAGLLLRSYNLLRELATRQSVELIAFVQEPWITTHFPSLEEGLAESQRALGEFCRRVTFLPIQSTQWKWGRPLTAFRALLTGSTYTTSWLNSRSGRSIIAKAIDTNPFDLVHFDTIGLAHYRDLAGRIPTTLTHHNIESQLMLRRAESTGSLLMRKYLRVEAQRLRDIERDTASSYDTHITCSDLDRDRLLHIAPNANVAVIANGVDCEYFAPQSQSPRSNSVVFVGSLNWHPNVNAMQYFLRDIWPGLKVRVPSATMDIGGSNPPEFLRRLADSLPDVTVHGYIPDVRPLIDRSAVYVCPIRDGGGTKLKILDAFAMGKCVVAHPIACEGIDAIDGEHIVLASTAEEFITAIQSLLGDDERRKTIGRAARQLVEKQYSYRELGHRFDEVMQGLAHKQPRSA